MNLSLSCTLNPKLNPKFLSIEFHPRAETDFYDVVKYDQWLESKAVRICNLPRESRLVFSLYGRRTVTQEKAVKKELTELGWGALQGLNSTNFRLLMKIFTKSSQNGKKIE